MLQTEALKAPNPAVGQSQTGPDRRTPEMLNQPRATTVVPEKPRAACHEIPAIKLAEANTKPEAVQAAEVKANDKQQSKDSVLADSARKVVHTGVITASALHAITAFGRVFPILPKSLQAFLENNALKVSKAVNAAGYAIESAAAFAAKRGFDAIGRLMHVLFVPWAKLEDIFLTGGLSSGPTSMMLAVNRKESPKSNWEDIKFHLSRVLQMTKQLFSFKSWFGKDRLVFKGWPRPGKVEEQEPHTLLLGGWLNLISPIIGLGPKLLKLPQTVCDLFRSAAAITRNAGSPVADWGKFNHEKKVVRTTGKLYIIVAILDLLQSGLKNQALKTTINHCLQVVTNFANYYYTRASAEMTEESKVADKQPVAPPDDKTQFAFSV